MRLIRRLIIIVTHLKLFQRKRKGKTTPQKFLLAKSGSRGQPGDRTVGLEMKHLNYLEASPADKKGWGSYFLFTLLKKRPDTFQLIKDQLINGTGVR